MELHHNLDHSSGIFKPLVNNGADSRVYFLNCQSKTKVKTKHKIHNKIQWSNQQHQGVVLNYHLMGSMMLHEEGSITTKNIELEKI